MTWTIGIAQFAPALGDIERNVATIEALVGEGRQAGLNLLIFPELALTGYTLKDMVPAVAQRLDAPVLRKLAAASEHLALAVGFVEESGDYRFYNSVAYLEAGQVRHVHRKVYLPTYGMFDECRYWAPGQRIRAFDTPFGRMAVLICEDMWHPSAAYVASRDGSTVLIAPSCSPARGVQDDSGLYSARAWRTLNLMYAHFFAQYVVFANRVGFEDGVGFWGGSEVVDPEGEVVARAPLYEEHLLVATISPHRIRRARTVSPLLRDEQLDLTLRELRRIAREEGQAP
jgi:predicted amidohydrolase